jgi:hypothetical protein
MADLSGVTLKDLIQAVSFLLSAYPKIKSAILAKFGRKKGKKIISTMYQELLKPNPDMASITDMMSEVEAIKEKPIGVLPRANLMKSLIQKSQGIKIVGRAKIGKAAKIFSARKISSRKPKASLKISISEVKRMGFEAKGTITPKGIAKVIKKGKKKR